MRIIISFGYLLVGIALATAVVPDLSSHPKTAAALLCLSLYTIIIGAIVLGTSKIK